MDVNKKGFHAKSNYITLENDGKHFILKKKYEEKLAAYDVKWPLSRCKVERETLRLLEKRLMHHDCLAVPHIYPASVSMKNMIEMEYIDGQTIYEFMSGAHACISSSSDDHSGIDTQINAHMFQDLFQFLYDLRTIMFFDLEKEFAEALHQQDPIVRCMYHNKLKDQVRLVSTGQGVFCLGDLSVHNMICRQDQLYLIDFECAHFGYDGYDIGQLLGMCQAYANVFYNTQAKNIYDIVGEGFRLFIKEYAIPDAYVRLCERWKERFCEYYRNACIDTPCVDE